MGVYKKQPKKISRLRISDIEKLMFYYRQKYITVFYGFIRCNKVDQNIYSDKSKNGSFYFHFEAGACQKYSESRVTEVFPFPGDSSPKPTGFKEIYRLPVFLYRLSGLN